MQRVDWLIKRVIVDTNASGLAPPANAVGALHIGAKDVSQWMAQPAGKSPPGAYDDAPAKLGLVDLTGAPCKPRLRQLNVRTADATSSNASMPDSMRWPETHIRCPHRGRPIFRPRPR
jgi:hypothetical protein